MTIPAATPALMLRVEPNWAMDTVTSWRAFGIGIAAVLTSMRLWVFTLGAVAVIQEGDLSRLPASLTFVAFVVLSLAPMIVIGNNYGLPALFGAIIASGVIVFLLTFVLEKVLMLFPKVVVGSFVTLIGVSLAPVAMADLAGGHGSRDGRRA